MSELKEKEEKKKTKVSAFSESSQCKTNMHFQV